MPSFVVDTALQPSITTLPGLDGHREKGAGGLDHADVGLVEAQSHGGHLGLRARHDPQQERIAGG